MALHLELAREAAQLEWCELGAEAAAGLARTVLDTVGCMLGSAPEAFADAALAALGETSGAGVCAVAGRRERLPMAAAAMANGTLAHGYDYDDVHMPSIAHLSAAVVPAAMAAAQSAGADGKTFLAAVAAGDEVAGRLGRALCFPELGGSAVRARGFFPTAILGTIGAAVAAARVARLDVGRMAQAIAIASSYAAGLAAISRGDNSTKRSQAGWAAQCGIQAAWMARHGFTGPDSVLETPQGFFEAYAGGCFREDRLGRSSGDPWVCEEMSFKWYPLEYMIHPLVELAVRSRPIVLPALERVTRIEASVPRRFATLFLPRPGKVRPGDRFMALISAPYCIARSLLHPGSGHLFLDDFRETGYRLDPQIEALAERVEFVENDALDEVFPMHVAGRLRVLAGNDTVWEGALDDVYGSPCRPLSDAHLMEKFRDNCRSLGPARTDALLESLGNIAQAPDAGWVAQLAG